VFRKLIGIIGLLVLFGGTLLMAHGLKGFDSVNWDVLKKGGIAFLVGGLFVRLGRDEITKLFPMSDKQKKRNQAIDERASERRAERRKRQHNRYQIQKQMRAQKAQDTQGRLDNSKYKRRKKALLKQINKHVKGQGFSQDEIQTIRSSLLDQFDDNLKYGTGKTINHGFPAQLNIRVPAHPHQAHLSWLGGNPSMPPNFEWPIIDGEPATFYAQIYCKDLPLGIWGSLGPKSGWLLFFCSRNHLSNLKVIHTREIGFERPSPIAVSHYDGYGSKRPAYNQLTGDVSGLAPKWPVQIMAVDEKTYPEYRVFSSNNSELGPWLQNFNNAAYDAPHMLPYDAVTLQYFVQAFDEYLSKRVDPSELKRIFRDKEKLKSLLTLHRAVQTQFTPLKDQTLAALAQNGFYNELLTYFIQGLRNINTIGFWAAPSYAQPNLFEHETPTRNFRHFLELYARMKYLKTAANLPEPHLSAYSTRWDTISKFESAYMGGQTTLCYPGLMTNPICLLELPTSSLMGWGFGDMDTLGVFITAHDLKAGRWDKAWGDVSN